jgi:hypothetical protein
MKDYKQEETPLRLPPLQFFEKKIYSQKKRLLIMFEDFWDTLKLATAVLNPALVALRYCDGMKGDTVALLSITFF